MQTIETDVPVAWCVSLSVTWMRPAKTAEWGPIPLQRKEVEWKFCPLSSRVYGFSEIFARKCHQHMLFDATFTN